MRVREASSRNGAVRLVDNSDAQRFEGFVGEELAGFIVYKPQPGAVALLHTEVDPAFEGHGVGSQLVADVLDDIRSRDLEVLPICPFVRGYIARHPEYADLVLAR